MGGGGEGWEVCGLFSSILGVHLCGECWGGGGGEGGVCEYVCGPPITGVSAILLLPWQQHLQWKTRLPLFADYMIVLTNMHGPKRLPV